MNLACFSRNICPTCILSLIFEAKILKMFKNLAENGIFFLFLSLILGQFSVKKNV